MLNVNIWLVSKCCCITQRDHPYYNRNIILFAIENTCKMERTWNRN